MNRLLRHPNFPLLLLLLIGLLAGLPAFDDYGLSWDEPLFYQYAAAIPSAYSIRARLDGTFNIEDAYGPSADHAAYGPAYLLLAQPLVDGLDALLPATQPDLWHLVNYLTFVLGALLLYGLCRRWVSPWAAFGAALLFLTQPVLWGHAWINPKDMPFLVFFIAAMLTGLRLVDALKAVATRSTSFPRRGGAALAAAPARLAGGGPCPGRAGAGRGPVLGAVAGAAQQPDHSRLTTPPRAACWGGCSPAWRPTPGRCWSKPTSARR